MPNAVELSASYRAHPLALWTPIWPSLDQFVGLNRPIVALRMGNLGGISENGRMGSLKFRKVEID